jgi:hypothetical protein
MNLPKCSPTSRSLPARTAVTEKRIVREREKKKEKRARERERKKETIRNRL